MALKLSDASFTISSAVRPVLMMASLSALLDPLSALMVLVEVSSVSILFSLAMHHFLVLKLMHERGIKN